jgi:hypothetical protein
MTEIKTIIPAKMEKEKFVSTIVSCSVPAGGQERNKWEVQWPKKLLTCFRFFYFISVIAGDMMGATEKCKFIKHEIQNTFSPSTQQGTKLRDLIW